MTCGAVLPVPCLDEGNVLSPTTTTAPEVKRSRSPEQTNPIGCVVGVEGRVREKRLNVVGKNKIIIVFRLNFNDLIRRGEEEERKISNSYNIYYHKYHQEKIRSIFLYSTMMESYLTLSLSLSLPLTFVACLWEMGLIKGSK